MTGKVNIRVWMECSLYMWQTDWRNRFSSERNKWTNDITNHCGLEPVWVGRYAAKGQDDLL